MTSMIKMNKNQLKCNKYTEKIFLFHFTSELSPVWFEKEMAHSGYIYDTVSMIVSKVKSLLIPFYEPVEVALQNVWFRWNTFKS